MTVQDVMDTYEFKVAKKVLMDRYPFIIDIAPTTDEDIIKYNSLLFVKIFVDGNKIQQYFEAPLRKTIFRDMTKGWEYYTPFLSMMFESNLEVNERTTKVQKDSDILFDKLHKSPAIPNELKIPKKTLHISTYNITPEQNQNLLRWEGGQLVDNSPVS